jgi:hypothetical protein
MSKENEKTKKPKNEEPTDVAVNNTAVAVKGGAPAGWDFSDSEVAESVLGESGYFRSYDFKGVVEQDELVVKDQNDKEIGRFKTTKVIVYHYHARIKLLRGHLLGLDTNIMDKWTDEEREMVAGTYGKGANNEDSQGSFKGELSEWLTDNEKNSQIVRRCWVIASIPDFKFGPIILALGSTASKSLNNVHGTCKRKGVSPTAIVCNLEFQKDKSKNEKIYYRAVFSPAYDADGMLQMNSASPDEWRGTHKLIADEARERHYQAIQDANAQSPDFGQPATTIEGATVEEVPPI